LICVVIIIIIIIIDCFDFEDDEPRNLLKAGVLLQVAHLLGSFAGWEIPARVARAMAPMERLYPTPEPAAWMPIARRMIASAVFWLFVAIGYESSK
jgi:hypothetical protein